jgi:Holliday junction resolvasome RuvABC endonuclease subunit
VDPGLANIGVGVLDWAPQGRSTVVALATITTDPGLTQPRVELIVSELAPHFVGAECVGIESQERAWQGKQQRGKSNAKSTLARVGEGVIRAMAAERGLPVIELEPQQTRASLGLPGNCDKARVLLVVKRLYKITQRVSGHAVDALGIAHGIGPRWSVLRGRPGALQPRT